MAVWLSVLVLCCQGVIDGWEDIIRAAFLLGKSEQPIAGERSSYFFVL